MKLTVKTTLAICLVTSLFFSCKNDDGDVDTGLSNEEAAEQSASIISSDIDGITRDVDILYQDLDSRSAEDGRIAVCDTGYDTTIVYNYEGANVTFDFSGTYGYSFICSNNIPSELSLDFTSQVEYEGPRVMTSSASEGNLTAGNLILGTAYDVDGTFVTTGSLIQKQRNQNTFEGSTNVTMTDVMVNKATRQIESGSATLNSTGTSSNGGSYQFTASVEFMGGGVAIVTVNDTQFSIDITTGEVTPL